MVSRFSLAVLGVGALCLGLLAFDQSRPADKPPEPATVGGEMVRIGADPEQAIRQGDTEGCGPVSLLNLLKLGPEPYRKAYAAISQGNDQRALALLVAQYCAPKGGDRKVRYSHESGIDDPNLSRLCELVAADFKLTPIETLYTTRKKDESNTHFAQRVNEALVRSLSRGVPVLMSIDSYGERAGKWEKLTGHYMLFTGAQRIGKTNPSSFLVEYVNPADGEHRQALVYASRRKHDGAFAHFKEGDQWLKDNPYLCLASPYTELGQGDLDSQARHEFFLTILFGSFEK
jgi:hypothetical protein